MPYIRAIFPESEKNVVRILRNREKKLAIRRTLSKIFPKYHVEQIVIIAEPLSRERMELSDNLLPLELTIDIGTHSETINDGHSDILTAQLIRYCPELNGIHFGVWLKEFSSNGFTEHKPTSSKKELPDDGHNFIDGVESGSRDPRR